MAMAFCQLALRNRQHDLPSAGEMLTHCQASPCAPDHPRGWASPRLLRGARVPHAPQPMHCPMLVRRGEARG